MTKCRRHETARTAQRRGACIAKPRHVPPLRHQSRLDLARPRLNPSRQVHVMQRWHQARSRGTSFDFGPRQRLYCPPPHLGRRKTPDGRRHSGQSPALTVRPHKHSRNRQAPWAPACPHSRPSTRRRQLARPRPPSRAETGAGRDKRAGYGCGARGCHRARALTARCAVLRRLNESKAQTCAGPSARAPRSTSFPGHKAGDKPAPIRDHDLTPMLNSPEQGDPATARRCPAIAKPGVQLDPLA